MNGSTVVPSPWANHHNLHYLASVRGCGSCRSRRKTMLWEAQMDPADVAIEITETERKLVGIWSEVLHIEQVPIDTTFLDFGTDSMLAAICAIRIWEVFNLELPETVLLED